MADYGTLPTAAETGDLRTRTPMWRVTAFALLSPLWLVLGCVGLALVIIAAPCGCICFGRSYLPIVWVNVTRFVRQALRCPPNFMVRALYLDQRALPSIKR